SMAREGLRSLFPIEELSIIGFSAVVKQLPKVLRLIRQTATAVLRAGPDILIIIDSPDFTHRVARRVRRALPGLPVVDYVSPTVWAWRPGRARKMRGYVDCVLALLPFEPAAHERLGGPRCVYVGHPLIERLDELRGGEREPNRLVVLPGSRRSVARRLMADFGGALAIVGERRGPIDVVLPTLPHVEAEVRALAAGWAVKPRIIVGEAEKFAAFRSARAALAASGTVTLELALSGTPFVGAYKVSKLEEPIARWLIRVPTILLPNLILEARAMPELLQGECNRERLAEALMPLLDDTPARAAQIAALARLDARMRLPGGLAPSEAAATAVMETVRCGAQPARDRS
ncbi:MAG: lipid-A-disaccharide synthase, partial [Roseiarcus sp.]